MQFMQHRALFGRYVVSTVMLSITHFHVSQKSQLTQPSCCVCLLQLKAVCWYRRCATQSWRRWTTTTKRSRKAWFEHDAWRPMTHGHSAWTHLDLSLLPQGLSGRNTRAWAGPGFPICRLSPSDHECADDRVIWLVGKKFSLTETSGRTF